MMDRKDQDHWVCEENIARFEGQLMLATSEKNRDHLCGLLASERSVFAYCLQKTSGITNAVKKVADIFSLAGCQRAVWVNCGWHQQDPHVRPHIAWRPFQKVSARVRKREAPFYAPGTRSPCCPWS